MKHPTLPRPKRRTAVEPMPVPLDPRIFVPRLGHPTALREDAKATLRALREIRDQIHAMSPLPYNFTVSHRYRFIWFRNAKVATRSILNYLVELHPDESELLIASRIPYPTAAFADYFKFGLVRHPLDRFISAWQDKVIRENHYKFDRATRKQMRTIENFAQWVAGKDLRSRHTDRHLALQSRMLDLNQIDHVGRLETFDEDFAEICRIVGMPVRTLERHNRSPETGITRENASQELRSIVEEKYRRDYQIFGY